MSLICAPAARISIAVLATLISELSEFDTESKPLAIASRSVALISLRARARRLFATILRRSPDVVTSDTSDSD